MAPDVGPLEALAGLLTPTELRRVASSLEIDRLPKKAAREAAAERREQTRTLLVAAAVRFGDPDLLAATLKAAATVGDRRPPTPQLVWSGPQLDGDSHRTTEAIVRLIHDAQESILASTYSGSASSPFVEALRRAAQRRVEITLVVDIVKMSAAAAEIAQVVPRATVLGYHYTHGTQQGLQHSKVLVIDGRTSLITSANLSVAALERNLETGILVEDADVARTITLRLSDLRASGHLRPLH